MTRRAARGAERPARPPCGVPSRSPAERSSASIARRHSPRIRSARPSKNHAQARENEPPIRSAISSACWAWPSAASGSPWKYASQVGPHVAEADHLDVPLLAGDLPALLDQAPCLLELAQLDEDPSLDPVAPRVGAAAG